MVPGAIPHPYSLQRHRDNLAGRLVDWQRSAGVLAAVKILQMTDGHWYGLALYVAVLGIISVIDLFRLPEIAPSRRNGEYHHWRHLKLLMKIIDYESHYKPVNKNDRFIVVTDFLKLMVSLQQIRLQPN